MSTKILLGFSFMLFFNDGITAQVLPAMLIINPLELNLQDDRFPFPTNPDFIKQHKIKEIYVYRELDIGNNQWYPLFEGVNYLFDKNGILTQKISLGQEDTIYKPMYDTVHIETYTYENGRIKRQFMQLHSGDIADVNYTYVSDTLVIKTYYLSYHKLTSHDLLKYMNSKLVESYDSSGNVHEYYLYNAKNSLIKQFTTHKDYPNYNYTIVYNYDSLQNLISMNRDGPYTQRYQFKYTAEGWLSQLDHFERSDHDPSKEEPNCTMYFDYGFEGRILSITKTGCTVPYWQTQRLQFVYTYY